ncbi:MULTISPECIES: IclR family transcriptional regulator [Roseomonadaceae]|uniref:Helix-turn-helix domain-containing protein n=1 Tax=Falsiroseomonas oleicola TaxID=2801474 RepID=A0ABS6H7V6_9PROT|nr:helix-turn-helix domain-containing protein [Roseomonas oleicola]MBU8544790.1 helix-turn-helix domain-containing protein [Roseomonas oleicola]
MNVKRLDEALVEPAAASWAAAGVSALERGLAVLDMLGEAGAPITLADLSRRTGFHKSTLLRILASLERCRYAARLADGRYRLGPALLSQGQAYTRAFDLHGALQPVLVRLAAATREAASFFIREGEGRVCLARAEGRQEVRDVVPLGAVLSMKGAAGHVLRLFAEGPRQDIPQVQGSFGERAAEVGALSVPVFRNGGILAGALTLSGTCTRFRDDAHRVAMEAALLREAALLTRELDGRA